MIRWTLFAVGCAVAGLAWALGSFPEVVESLYGSGPGLWIPRSLSLVTGWSSRALAPLLLGALVLVGGVLAVLDFRRARARDLGRGRAVLAALGWPLGIGGTLMIVFYMAWGFNYGRPPLEERLGLESADSIGADELEALAREAVAQANLHYRLIHEGSDDVGGPTVLPFTLEEGSVLLERGWASVAREMGLPEILGERYGPVKARGISLLLEMFDISGVYAPFTGEALINGRPPAVSIPAVMAHEQAHQRGFAPEDEASFMGVMAAIRSGDPMVRYSAWADSRAPSREICSERTGRLVRPSPLS